MDSPSLETLQAPCCRWPCPGRTGRSPEIPFGLRGPRRGRAASPPCGGRAVPMATGAERWRHFRPGRGQHRPRLGGRNGRGASGSAERGRGAGRMCRYRAGTGTRAGGACAGTAAAEGACRDRGAAAGREGGQCVLVGGPTARSEGGEAPVLGGGHAGRCGGDTVVRVCLGGPRGSVRVWDPPDGQRELKGPRWSAEAGRCG